MKRPILLDTNILIWALNDDTRLTRRLRSVISSPDAEVRVSVVSAWEILVKYQVGKLTFDVPIEEVLTRILSGIVVASSAGAAFTCSGITRTPAASSRSI